MLTVRQLISKLSELKEEDKDLPVSAIVDHRRAGEYSPIRSVSISKFNEQESSGDPDPYNDNRVVILG